MAASTCHAQCAGTNSATYVDSLIKAIFTIPYLVALFVNC